MRAKSIWRRVRWRALGLVLLKGLVLYAVLRLIAGDLLKDTKQAVAFGSVLVIGYGFLAELLVFERERDDK